MEQHREHEQQDAGGGRKVETFHGFVLWQVHRAFLASAYLSIMLYVLGLEILSYYWKNEPPIVAFRRCNTC